MGGIQGRFWRVRNISPPTWIRSPDGPACSESLYGLTYAGLIYWVDDKHFAFINNINISNDKYEHSSSIVKILLESFENNNQEIWALLGAVCAATM